MSRLHTLRRGGFLFLTLDGAPARNAPAAQRTALPLAAVYAVWWNKVERLSGRET